MPKLVFTSLIAIWFLTIGFLSLCASQSLAQEDYEVSSSPKRPWGEFTISRDDEGGGSDNPWWQTLLLWVPNRVLDAVDIFRLDVGIGPAIGAVGRISKAGQFGYRDMLPASVRIGAFGRRVPVLVENSSEFGLGPGFVQSNERRVCPGEIGAGADLFIVGAYGGFCIDEFFDFIAGIFFFDVSGDDVK